VIGPLGGKPHTGRSRNDQVTRDMRLRLLGAIGEVETALKGIIHVLVECADKKMDYLMPGYTHLQKTPECVADNRGSFTSTLKLHDRGWPECVLIHLLHVGRYTRPRPPRASTCSLATMRSSTST
jgi:hypothetical protein